MSKIWIDPVIAHIVCPDDVRCQETMLAVHRFMKESGYSNVPTMGDDFYVESLCKDENGVDGFISGNDWGNVKEMLEEQLKPHGLRAEFVEFLGTAWYKVVKA